MILLVIQNKDSEALVFCGLKFKIPNHMLTWNVLFEQHSWSFENIWCIGKWMPRFCPGYVLSNPSGKSLSLILLLLLLLSTSENF